MDIESIRTLLIALGFIVLIIGVKAIANFRKRHLSAIGDAVDGTVISSSYHRKSLRSEVSQSGYYYQLLVEYRHQGVSMINKMKVSEDEMARFFPHVVRSKQFPITGTIPILVNPKNPKRIIMNSSKLMRQIYPEAFGSGSDSTSE